ncbi:RND family transporter [Halomicrobium sp. HM KBTZ05]|uniref:efflux RND transporter permease subunit n=1 Tax=Halomicrobium sp. HM KBTZ05 TaxID=3242663 RepID=UPI0035561BC0
MSWIDRPAAVVTEHSIAVVLVVLVVTGAFGAGLGQIEQSSSVSGLSGESDVAEAYDDARTNFSTREANTTTSLIAVHNESDNALSRASLVRTLRYQRALERNETLAPTLTADEATVSIASLVARAAIGAEEREELCNCTITGWSNSPRTDGNVTAGAGGEASSPTLDEQIAQLASMDQREVAAVVEHVLDPEVTSQTSRAAYQLLPRGYEPGSTTADSHLIVVTQETDGEVRAAAAISEEVSAGQQAARAIATDQPGSESYYIYSRGLVSPQQNAAMSDSLGILGPMALLFVLLSLSIAYRDPIDVVLGLIGVGVVLVWTMGSLGWLGIAFNQTMVAVPILLIGLSVDYALHVVMRYREERGERDDGVRSAMRRSLVGVGPALVLVTLTTAIGFLANLTSPLGDIRSFGIVTAIGIVATLAVFGLFVPAAKTVTSSLLARFGFTDTPAVLGSTGFVRRVLGTGAAAARRAPFVVVAIALLVGAGGAYGATQVDVATPQTAFMADDPPAWTEELPASMQPSEFYLKDNRAFVYANFQAPDKRGFVLVEGAVDSPTVLEGVAAANETAAEYDAVFAGPGGTPEIVTPLSAMRQAARQNETFNATFHGADTDGDGIPDRDVATVYDAFHDTAPDLATRTVHRTEDGRYTAIRIRIATEGNRDRDAAVAPLLAVSTGFDDVDGVDAIATGQPVISKNLNDGLATTMVESLTLTLVVVLALLAIVFRLREGSASLGALTLAPVVLSVTWLLGTMAALDIPIGLITAMVGSLSVGLGVDYAIHVSERFAEERAADHTTERALQRTVTGTGSALLSSAVTTAAGFGVLSFSLLPALQQFGFILATGIVYSFLACIYVQPSLLALWDEYVPAWTETTEPSVSPGDD